MSFLVIDRGLAVVDGVVVELLAAGHVEQRLRIRRPDRRVLLVVEIGDLLRRAAFGIGDPDFIAAGSIRHERDVLAVGRPLRRTGCATPCDPGLTRVMSPRSVAMVRICPRAEIAARRPDGEMSNASTSSLTARNSTSFSLSSVPMSILISLLRPAGDVELPDAEVVFVDDGLAVARHRRPEQAAVGVLRHLHRRRRPSRESCRCC